MPRRCSVLRFSGVRRNDVPCRAWTRNAIQGQDSPVCKARSRSESPDNLASTAACPVSLRPNARGFSEQAAKLQTHTPERACRDANPGRFQVANLEPSKRCSRMPLIGLVRLRRALEGAIPSFDPIWPALAGRVLGDTETASGRQWPDDLLPSESRCKSGSGDVPQGRNPYRTRRLMSVQRCTRAARGNLARSAPRETGGL
jgi:hypothetical protein